MFTELILSLSVFWGVCVGGVVELTSGYYYNTRTLVMRDRPDINLVSLLPSLSHQPPLHSALDLDGRLLFWILGLASWEFLKGQMTTLRYGGILSQWDKTQSKASGREEFL